jgi:hypothetical protein
MYTIWVTIISMWEKMFVVNANIKYETLKIHT